MPRFIPGDYARPINTNPGLPLDSVWVVQRYHNRDDGTVVLRALSQIGPGSYPLNYDLGCVFADCDFEKVAIIDGWWRAVKA